MESVKLEIKREYIIAFGIVLLLAILVGAGFMGKNKYDTSITKAKEDGRLAGYNQALVDIAYVASTKINVTYMVPTTNITITLIPIAYK